MVAQVSNDSKLTKMTLAVAQDSGWYQVDMSAGENYFWGKDAGCEIFNFGCPKEEEVDEVCSAINSIGCSRNFIYRTKCTKSTFNPTCPIDTYEESCKIRKETDKQWVSYGVAAVCANTLVNAPFGRSNSQFEDTEGSGCFKINCDSAPEFYDILMGHQGKELKLTCRKGGPEKVEIVPEYFIKCEDPEVVCSTLTKCPKSCNYR